MRLTEKRKTIDCDYIELLEHNAIVEKLGKLEDIEDELGFDLILLEKICQSGVYCYKRAIKSFNFVNKKLDEIIHIQNSDIHVQFFGVYNKKRIGVSILGSIDFCFHSLPIKDYGKTWALTKEELL